MSYVACRSEHYITAFLATLLLYSFSYSVIAQDKSIPDYRLSLSHLPKDFGKLSPIPQIKYINSEASLRISPKENHNLLLSYLEPDNVATTTEGSGQSLAYIAPSTHITAVDKRFWENEVKARYKNGLIRSVSPGIKHIVIQKYTKAGSIRINVVEVNPEVNPAIRIKPALAGETLPHVAKIQNITRKNGAVAGINASFFKTTTGVPLGTLIINQELITGPIYDRVALGIKNNKFKMARISLQGKVIAPHGDEIKIDNVNQPRMLATYNLLYSDKWGKLAPPTPQYGLQVAIYNERVINISKDRLEIPEKGYVLVGTQKSLGKLKIDDPVKVSFSTTPDWSDVDHAISGGPYLVKEGQIFVDAADQKFGSITGRNPRTAVGYTSDDRLIMVTIDGRQKGSVGVSLYELAKIMKGFGCYNAMNLDGGSSTQMIVNGRVVNNPLNAGGNNVSNGLVVMVGD